MTSINSTIFHAYAYGTAFWYALRGLCRVWDPLMVVGWFRPPSQANLQANDLELYNVRNDGWCLITLALVLVTLTNAVPPSGGTAKSGSVLPYAKGIVAATIFHHLMTGIGAFDHYKRETHYNTSMAIGVWGNVWLTVTGAVTLASLYNQKGDRSLEGMAKKGR